MKFPEIKAELGKIKLNDRIKCTDKSCKKYLVQLSDSNSNPTEQIGIVELLNRIRSSEDLKRDTIEYRKKILTGEKESYSYMKTRNGAVCYMGLFSDSLKKTSLIQHTNFMYFDIDLNLNDSSYIFTKIAKSVNKTNSEVIHEWVNWLWTKTLMQECGVATYKSISEGAAIIIAVDMEWLSNIDTKEHTTKTDGETFLSKNGCDTLDIKKSLFDNAVDLQKVNHLLSLDDDAFDNWIDNLPITYSSSDEWGSYKTTANLKDITHEVANSEILEKIIGKNIYHSCGYANAPYDVIQLRYGIFYKSMIDILNNYLQIWVKETYSNIDCKDANAFDKSVNQLTRKKYLNWDSEIIANPKTFEIKDNEIILKETISEYTLMFDDITVYNELVNTTTNWIKSKTIEQEETVNKWTLEELQSYDMNNLLKRLASKWGIKQSQNSGLYLYRMSVAGVCIKLGMPVDLAIQQIKVSKWGKNFFTETHHIDRFASCWNIFNDQFSTGGKIKPNCDTIIPIETIETDENLIIPDGGKLSDVLFNSSNLEKKKIRIISPTSSGKTFAIMKLIKEDKSKLPKIFLAPVTGLVDQIVTDAKGIKAIGLKAGVKLTNPLDWDLIVSTYDSLPKIINNAELSLILDKLTLIIDEEHSLITEGSYRGKAISTIFKKADIFNRLIALTGTPVIETSEAYYKDFFNIKAQYQTPLIKPMEIYKKSGFNELDIEKHFVKGKLNLVYYNNKDSKLVNLFTKRGWNCQMLNSDNKEDSSVYKSLVSDSLIDESIEVLICTKMIESGVNILNDNCASITVIWDWDREVSVESIEQFANRIRKRTSDLTTYLYLNKMESTFIPKDINNFFTNYNEDKLELVNNLESVKNIISRDLKAHNSIITSEAQKETYDKISANIAQWGYIFTKHDNDWGVIIDIPKLLYSNYQRKNKLLHLYPESLFESLKSYNYNVLLMTPLEWNDEDILQIIEEKSEITTQSKTVFNMAIEDIILFIENSLDFNNTPLENLKMSLSANNTVTKAINTALQSNKNLIGSDWFTIMLDIKELLKTIYWDKIFDYITSENITKKKWNKWKTDCDFIADFWRGKESIEINPTDPVCIKQWELYNLFYNNEILTHSEIEERITNYENECLDLGIISPTSKFKTTYMNFVRTVYNVSKTTLNNVHSFRFHGYNIQFLNINEWINSSRIANYQIRLNNLVSA